MSFDGPSNKTLFLRPTSLSQWYKLNPRLMTVMRVARMSLLLILLRQQMPLLPHAHALTGAAEAALPALPCLASANCRC